MLADLVCRTCAPLTCSSRRAVTRRVQRRRALLPAAPLAGMNTAPHAGSLLDDPRTEWAGYRSWHLGRSSARVSKLALDVA
jgi:hypothetical protein